MRGIPAYQPTPQQDALSFCLAANSQQNQKFSAFYRSRIHKRTISLRFLGMILKVLRLQVSVYNVYITKQFHTTFAQGVGGVKSFSRGDCELRILSQLHSRLRSPISLAPFPFGPTAVSRFSPHCVQYIVGSSYSY
jgi:hypothetical protein